jgi:DNA-binding response OmpR family regulator
MKVMVVEEDRDLRSTLVDILEGQDYLVASAENAHEADQILTRDPPHLVVVDLVPPHLYDRSGLRELCARLEELAMPTIAITSMMVGPRELPAQCTVLSKPFGLDAFLGAVRAHVTGVRQSGCAAR